jgi:hypothetical protein
MPYPGDNLSEARFRRLARVKQSPAPVMPSLGPAMVSFFKQSVAKRQTKFARIADCWSQLVPEVLADHCSLESFTRGSLVVLVDSASHLYELKQLLLAGLEQQLLLACATVGLKKINLKPGRWYEGDDQAARKPRF